MPKALAAFADYQASMKVLTQLPSQVSNENLFPTMSCWLLLKRLMISLSGGLAIAKNMASAAHHCRW